MMVQKDKIQHAVGGALVAAGGLAVHLVGQRFGAPWAMALAAAGIGIGYEVVQHIRREGEPSTRDALATAAGGAALALAWHLAAVWGAA